MVTAFQIIKSLEHDTKPDYNYLKLLMAHDEKDEQFIFRTRMNVSNRRLDNILYDMSDLKDNTKAKEVAGESGGVRESGESVPEEEEKK